MRIGDFMQRLYQLTDSDEENYKATCDTLKVGNPDEELHSVATSMFATADVIEAAAQWGANLLIVHEPTFYQHWDNPEDLDKTPEWLHKVIVAKRKFIADHGLTIYRFHDHPHRCVPDMISEGQCKHFGLTGAWHKGDSFAVNRFILDEPMPLLELTAVLERNLDIRHIRICGDRDTLVTSIGLCFGTPGHLEEELAQNDIVLTGEICEWATGEYVRDLTGILHEKKALLVLGHLSSEKQGMKLLAERIVEQWPGVPAKYFDSPEPYTYTN